MNTPDWIWYAEDDDGKPVISLGRWPKTAGQVRYIQAPIQPTEHDHPLKGTGTKLDPKALEAAREG